MTADPPPVPPGESVPLKDLAGEKTGALNPQDTVSEAAERMRDHDAAVWPVVENRKLVGVVDEENPDLELSSRGHDPHTWKVGEIMSRELVYCHEDQGCAAALRVMEQNGLELLPVVDRNLRIVGLFTREEIESRLAETGR